MATPIQLDSSQLQRLRDDMMDSLDEELENEFEDVGFGDDDTRSPEAIAFRRFYFRELIKLQGELVKLQDWVVTNKHRMVIVFEGRDAAGKGGVIKRITQRLNPRICRVAALPAPNDR